MHADTATPLRVGPDALKFNTSIQHSKASSVYEVTLNNDRYCLKVYHDNGDPGYAPDGRDLNRLRCELNAYRNLQIGGVCQKGVVPRYIDHFANDINKPGGILLGFLSNTESFNCVNYSHLDDFDIAMSYSDSQLQDGRVQMWFEDEIEWAASFGNLLRKDQERGESPNLKYY
ncbi:hypothetical protein BDV25DRAFT_171838 [Aspergillus avenaceus]|uniref:Uncharacterized protein n=1 Tax=Aspergillus avenaceus TaxID=36643 RepID=A0A5N6TX38_ASPAV|nr:hypothetical protein BDV25DRAFT_171838 [Aspergillus avenaceus]